MEVRQKRYQYFSRNGIAWSKWFNYNGYEFIWQLKGHLKNEYRTIQASSQN